MLAALQSAARADTVIAAGTIRGQTLIMPSDVALAAGATPGALAGWRRPSGWRRP
jgi:flagellar basal body P-ring formation protein FlgA